MLRTSLRRRLGKWLAATLILAAVALTVTSVASTPRANGASDPPTGAPFDDEDIVVISDTADVEPPRKLAPQKSSDFPDDPLGAPPLNVPPLDVPPLDVPPLGSAKDLVPEKIAPAGAAPRVAPLAGSTADAPATPANTKLENAPLPPDPIRPPAQAPVMAQDIEADDAPAAVAQRSGPSIHVANVAGIQPGTTTSDELHDRWGSPEASERIAGGIREKFLVEPWGEVRAVIRGGAVASLDVKLAKPMSVEALARRLTLEDVEPVGVFDDDGHPLGMAYPERGVLAGFVPGSDPIRVFQVAIEGIDVQSFLARAELRMENRYVDCLADLNVAIQQAPDCGRAYWMYSELARRTGELNSSLSAVQKAIELEPNEIEYRLSLAKVLAESGDHKAAMRQLRELAESKTTGSLMQARAYCQWGDCLAGGPQPDYAQALKLHNKAIALAQPLASSKKLSERCSAKEVLLDAHLAVAHDIGWGRWQQKSTAVPKWIERAMVYADDLIAHDNGDTHLRLRTYEQALAAIAGIEEPPDSNRWIRDLTTLGAELLENANDKIYRAHVSRRMGLALANAVEIESALKNSDKAMKLGQMSLEYFAQADVAGRVESCDLVRAGVCYRLGVILAVEHNDHARAISWYNQARPLLTTTPVVTASFDEARQGEIFVSMAVSYWELNRRDDAVSLTEQGVKLMEQAAKDGQLNKTALAIPYSNLSSMHEQLGHAKQAKQYAEKAAHWEEPASK